MSLPSRSVKPVQGALLLALSALLFSLMGVGIREVSSGVNNESVVFFRNLVGVLFFLPLLLFKGAAPLKTGRIKSHLWRTGYGLAAMYCFFYAIAHLPLADAMLFTYSAPVFTPVLAWWLLKEKARFTQLFGAGIALAGMGIVPSGVADDSRQVQAGDLFLAYPGALADGRRYIGDALARGAVAVLWQPGDDFAWSHDGPNFPVPALRPLAGPLAHMA